MNPNNPIILSLILLILPFRIGPNDTHCYIIARSFGGYSEHCEDQEITLIHGATGGYRNVRDRVLVYDSSGSIAYEKIYGEFSIEVNRKTNRTITLPTKRFLEKSGMRCIISIVNSEATKAYCNYDFTIYPVEAIPEVDLDRSNNRVFSTLPTKYSLEDGGVDSDSIDFNFSGLSDYFKIDNYYRLSVSSFKFTISENVKIYSENSYILLENPAECFFSLMDEDNEVKIPITVKESRTTTKTLTFADTFYVEPSTLKMSLTPKIGYVETKHFYFPINHLEDVLNQKFVFKINQLGTMSSRMNITFECSFNTDVRLIGDCNNSEYCLIGGVR